MKTIEEPATQLPVLAEADVCVIGGLHTLGCRPLLVGDRVDAMLIENKDGRGAVRARVFIDATGDGDVAVRAGVPSQVRDRLQPPTTCAKILNFHPASQRFSDLYHGNGSEAGRWREPTPENPTHYEIPYRCLHHPAVSNLLSAGRMICTDRGAFGAIRVMVNLNQVGEAAGVAAALAVRNGCPVGQVAPAALRRSLADGGSIIL